MILYRPSQVVSVVEAAWRRQCQIKRFGGVKYIQEKDQISKGGSQEFRRAGFKCPVLDLLNGILVLDLSNLIHISRGGKYLLSEPCQNIISSLKSAPVCIEKKKYQARPWQELGQCTANILGREVVVGRTD